MTQVQHEPGERQRDEPKAKTRSVNADRGKLRRQADACPGQSCGDDEGNQGCRRFIA